ncbi:unnamed protein product [Ectocarpus sp. 8 AP-2014]
MSCCRRRARWTEERRGGEITPGRGFPARCIPNTWFCINRSALTFVPMDSPLPRDYRPIHRPGASALEGLGTGTGFGAVLRGGRQQYIAGVGITMSLPDNHSV